MGLVTQQINEKEFKATIHTLTCEITGKRLAEIMVQVPDENIVAIVEATSPFSEGATSGKHRITGVLAFGPIESDRFPTTIRNVDVEEVNDEMIVKLKVENAKSKK